VFCVAVAGAAPLLIAGWLIAPTSYLATAITSTVFV